MLHERRRFHVADVEGVYDLCEKLTQHTWTLCTGFRLRAEGQTLLFLNDSTSEDGAQEYAVFAGDRQVESITFGWCTLERAEELVCQVLDGRVVDMGSFELRLDESPDHVCHLCR
ncbi:MAG: hypothetical protein R3B81_14255 [bacterium]